MDTACKLQLPCPVGCAASGCAPVLADQPLQSFESGGQQEVGGEHGAEAGDGRVQLLVQVCRVGIPVASRHGGGKQRAAVGMEPAVQCAQLVQACREVGRNGTVGVQRCGQQAALAAGSDQRLAPIGASPSMPILWTVSASMSAASWKE